MKCVSIIYDYTWLTTTIISIIVTSVYMREKAIGYISMLIFSLTSSWLEYETFLPGLFYYIYFHYNASSYNLGVKYYPKILHMLRIQQKRNLFPHPWWRHQMETFSALLALCERNLPVTGGFPSQGQWRGALMFSLICPWTNAWANNRDAGDVKRYRVNYDVTVMFTSNLALNAFM